MKYLMALVALGCVGVGIVALATPRAAIKDVSAKPNETPKVKSEDRDTSVPKKLRVYTRQDLKTEIGQLAWRHLATFDAAGAHADRLEMIRAKHPNFQLTATSWMIRYNTVVQKADGVHVELEISPSLLAGQSPALIEGKIKETWVIKKIGDRTECRCHARGFDGYSALIIH